MRHAYFDLPVPTVLGHRGAAGDAPENTLEAFRKGLEDGAHILESDIHGSRDGVPVLIHDPHIDRTTNGQGSVSEYTLSELQGFDAGHGFSSDATGSEAPQGAGLDIRIPSLREAFETFPLARFNFEIKACSPDLVASIVALVLEFDRENRTLLTAGESEGQKVLRAELLRSGARPAQGACLEDILEIVRSAQANEAPKTESMVLQIPKDFAGEPLVTPELLTHCHAHGIPVHVWTINDPESMRQLLDMGVDGIVTDYPGRMARLLADPQ